MIRRTHDYDEHTLVTKPDIYLIFIESYGSVLYKRPYYKVAYETLLKRMKEFENKPALPKPLVTGRDLLDAGMKQGPEIGRRLKKAYDLQLNKPSLKKDELLEHTLSA